MFALWVASFELFERYWWVPLVVDAGSLPLVAHTILFFLLGRRFRESRRKWLLIGACLVGTCLGGVLIALAAILLLEMCGFTGISDKDWAAGIAGGILVVGVLFFFRPFKRARRVGEDHENGT
jgi:MFS family permease